jgi:two-component system, chemotaxis family, protein-glutamate methylesterase/glutaminase
MIRVLIVDDSATMRRLIAAILRRDPEIEVVGEAGDPFEAREAIKALNPDVLTLDVVMPTLHGLDFLEKIMRLRPMPVVMVSTLTVRGAEATLEALALGAIDCVAKPSTGGFEAFQDLADKVKVAACARVRPTRSVIDRPPAATLDHAPDGRVLAIGSSTGGVEALITLLGRFPANCPATVITQHMPATFTKGFADRLDRLCAPRIEEAQDGAPLEVGRIYVAPGGPCHLEVTGGSKLRCRVQPGDTVSGHRPSVDVLFRSVAKAVGGRAAGAILTGMGRDGAAGLLAMREAGARTLGQDEASCVVYGMPKAAFEAGAVERQVPLDRMAAELLKSLTLNQVETR